MHADETSSIKLLVRVWASLLLLLALTVGSAYLPLGAMNAAINLSIAGLKTALIAAFFMRLAVASNTTRIVALTGLFWVLIMLGLTLADFLTR